MRRLTASTTEGREWSGDDDEGVVSSSRLRQKRCDSGAWLGSSGAIRPVRAAGRIDVEVEIGIALREQGSSGIEHRLL